jgi:hypothetical protein
MQLYGNVTSALKIVQDNPTVLSSLNSGLNAGMEIEYTVQNVPLTNLFKNFGITTTYPQLLTTGGFSDGFSDGFDN